nr:putative E3 ubiquitin-protein ligase RF298 [Ipomoea batatas]
MAEERAKEAGGDSKNGDSNEEVFRGVNDSKGKTKVEFPSSSSSLSSTELRSCDELNERSDESDAKEGPEETTPLSEWEDPMARNKLSGIASSNKDGIDFSIPLFDRIESLAAYILLEMVCVLKEVKPFFSVAEAMRPLLICDLNMLEAVEHGINVDLQPQLIETYSQARSQLLLNSVLPTVKGAYALLLQDEKQRTLDHLGTSTDVTALQAATQNSNMSANFQDDFHNLTGTSFTPPMPNNFQTPMIPQQATTQFASQ